MNRIKELRKLKKIQQKRIAKELGVAPITVKRWEENGSIKTEHAIKLAELLETDIAYLLGYSDHPKQVNENDLQLPNKNYYIIKVHELTINIIRAADDMTAQELSDIKKAVRGLYEELILMQYEAEKKGKNE